ncbi:unnamed protein product [Sphagnum jensenii]|uniref:Uncharacterized protein n=1 Tax=Sphagnum jensenii TaxID=128206 RepID=A0ABP1ATW8_9BRYO
MSLWIRLPWKTKNTCCKRAKCGHDNRRQHETQSSRGSFVPRAPTAHPFALQAFPLKGDSACSLCKSFASCADCCESALSISTFCCFLGFPELLLMR